MIQQSTPLGIHPEPSDLFNKRATAKKRRLRIALVVILLMVTFACYIGVFGGNVRIVQKGRLYRSSQLTGYGYEAQSARLVGHSLPDVIHEYGIKTLINLRGGSMKDERYREEVADCEQLGVDHIDIPFSARRLPSPAVVEALFNAYDHARYPIIVHCQSGSDRTGLACTLYANIYEGEPLDTAEHEELTWRFGHFSFGQTRAMNLFFDLYRTTSHGMALRQWVHDSYPTIYAASPLKMDSDPSASGAAIAR